MSGLTLALSIPFGSMALIGAVIWWFGIRPNTNTELQTPTIIIYTEGIGVVRTGPSIPGSLPDGSQARQCT